MFDGWWRADIPRVLKRGTSSDRESSDRELHSHSRKFRRSHALLYLYKWANLSSQVKAALVFLFYLSCSATSVQLSNLKIRDCGLDSEDAPVIVRAGSNLTLNSTSFTNNTNEAGSAALKMEADSQLTVQGCHFNGNNGSRGTIHVTNGKTLNISSSTFVNNHAYLGGGALQIEVDVRRDIILNGCL